MISKPNILTHIRERISANPDSIVREFRLEDDHRTDTYLELWEKSGSIAFNIARAGIKEGSPVVIVAESVGDFLPAFWACLRTGMIAAPMTGLARAALARNETGFDEALATLESPCIILDKTSQTIAARASLKHRKVLFFEDVKNSVEWADDETGSSEIACVLPTSGSTGAVKLAKLSHSALIHRYLLRPALNPHVIGLFPLDGITGHQAIYLRHRSWTQISREILLKHPARVVDAVETFKASFINLNASLIAAILREESRRPRKWDLSSLRVVGVGGEPISFSLAQDFASFLVKHGADPSALQVGYGTTETGPLVTGSSVVTSTDPERPLCLGAPRPHIKMRVVDEIGETLARDHIGELQVHCPDDMFSGYWGDPRSLPELLTRDGWWPTGDLGRVVEGEVSLHGRTKDILIVNGRKFSLGEIDLSMHGALKAGEVANCCVLFSDENESLGVGFYTDEPARCAVLVSELRSIILQRFGLRAKIVIGLDRIPLTTAGKLDRRELGRQIQQLKPGAKNNIVDGLEVSEAVKAAWCQALGLAEPVGIDASFHDLGGDSLRSLSLYTELIDTFGVRIDSDRFFADPTLRHLIQLVEIQLSSATKPASRYPTDLRWPLPEELHGKLMAALALWPGKRMTRSGMLLGHQVEMSGTPIFWILNTRPEADWLLSAFKDRPLYVFRSGADISNQRDEDAIQAFALRYMADMEEVFPNGPFIIGGQCQGGRIALAIAQHAMRRGHHVPLLVLSDWAFPPSSYPGQILLVSGHRTNETNARSRFAIPAVAWKNAFSNFESVELEGSSALSQLTLDDFGSAVRSRLETALQAPTNALPQRSRNAGIAADVSRFVVAGGESSIVTLISNNSDQAWQRTEVSGLTVGYRWIDENGDVISTKSYAASLPTLAPGSSAKVVMPCQSPSITGDYLLSIDICEQGREWFHPLADAGFTMPVRVRQSRLSSLSQSIRRFIKLGRDDIQEMSFEFSLNSETLDLLVSGWSSPEEWGIWSIGSQAKLRLPLMGVFGRWRAVVQAHRFGQDGQSLEIGVQAPGDVDKTWRMLANSRGSHSFDFSARGQDMLVTLLSPGAISPYEIGISEDKRCLGISLKSIILKRL